MIECIRTYVRRNIVLSIYVVHSLLATTIYSRAALVYIRATFIQNFALWQPICATFGRSMELRHLLLNLYVFLFLGLSLY